ncbi:MAG: sugar phosphate isomerase/epimerase, partial [Bacteroidetes bacterium]
MNIKNWRLKILLFVGVVAIAIQGLTSFSFKPKEKYVGLQLYSVRDDMKKDVKGTVEKVGEMGYKF